MNQPTRGAGRPHGSTSSKPTRDTVKQIRWTTEEWQEIENMSAEAGLTPSKWIRMKCSLRNNHG